MEECNDVKMGGDKTKAKIVWNRGKLDELVVSGKYEEISLFIQNILIDGETEVRIELPKNNRH